MIAHVESTPKLEALRVFEIPIICKQFVAIQRRITKSANRMSLENQLEEFKSNVCWNNETHYFHWGFGGSHMWVKQHGNDTRLIFVPILNEHI
jgi:hypothetical protein